MRHTDIAPLIATKTFTTFSGLNVDPIDAVILYIGSARLYYNGSSFFDIVGESLTTFSTIIFRHSGKSPLLTKVEFGDSS